MVCIVAACAPLGVDDTGRDPQLCNTARSASFIILNLSQASHTNILDIGMKRLIEDEGEGQPGKEMNRFHFTCACNGSM